MNDLRNKLYVGWTYDSPPLTPTHQLDLSDDGIEMYAQYNNNWIIFGELKGKIALFNDHDPTIVIKSISAWKVSDIEK